MAAKTTRPGWPCPCVPKRTEPSLTFWRQIASARSEVTNRGRGLGRRTGPVVWACQALVRR